MKRQRPSGMTAFMIVVSGQIVSLMGSTMTTFALGFWAWEMTEQATTFSLTMLFGFAPTIFLGPIAGTLVDRWNRKLVMMLSDLAAGFATLTLFILLKTGNLEIWHLYIANAFMGMFNAFQFPAFSSIIALMVPKAQYGRANGMMWLTGPSANVFGPILAAALLGLIGLEGIMLIDLVSCLAAVGTLLFVFVPQPRQSAAGRAGQGSFFKEMLYGFRYIFERRSLLGIQLVFFSKNIFTYPALLVLLSPMILARSGNNELLLGSVMSAGAIGGLIGGIVLSAWGGPKRRIHGILLGMIALRLFGQGLLGFGRGLFVWAGANFILSFFIPIVNGANQAIWQAKVPPDIQGRVFSARRMIAQFPTSFAMLWIGPLADRVFEPAMMADGALAPILGPYWGTGPGAGMAVLISLGGLIGALIGAAGYLFSVIRNAEDILPDHKDTYLARHAQ